LENGKSRNQCMPWSLGKQNSDDLLRQFSLKTSYMWIASHTCNYYGMHYGLDMHSQKNELYNILLSITKGTPLSEPPPNPALALNYNPDRESALASLLRSLAIHARVTHFQRTYALLDTSVCFVQISGQFTKDLKHSQSRGTHLYV
jgi:hypothetical protein